MAEPAVAYPSWYVRRWHFLPEGYLSRRSVAAYDAMVRNVYNVAAEGEVIRTMVRRVREARPANVLDLGCGPGRYLAALRKALPVSDLTGADLSPFMLELARDRLATTPGIRLVHGDACELPFEDASFEAITATHFFGHLPKAEAATALAEARRLLAPGGRLFVVDHSWHPRIGTRLRSLGLARLLGGLQRLEVFEPA